MSRGTHYIAKSLPQLFFTPSLGFPLEWNFGSLPGNGLFKVEPALPVGQKSVFDTELGRLQASGAGVELPKTEKEIRGG